MLRGIVFTTVLDLVSCGLGTNLVGIVTGECFTLININVAAQQKGFEVGHQVQGLAQFTHARQDLPS